MHLATLLFKIYKLRKMNNNSMGNLNKNIYYKIKLILKKLLNFVSLDFKIYQAGPGLHDVS